MSYEDVWVAYGIAITLDPMHPVWEIKCLAWEDFEFGVAKEYARAAVAKGSYIQPKSWTMKDSRASWILYQAVEHGGEGRALAIELRIPFAPDEDGEIVGITKLERPYPDRAAIRCRMLDLDEVMRCAMFREPDPVGVYYIKKGLAWLKRQAAKLRHKRG